jgi:MtaA/CmuA family methyltransferase
MGEGRDEGSAFAVRRSAFNVRRSLFPGSWRISFTNSTESSKWMIAIKRAPTYAEPTFCMRPEQWEIFKKASRLEKLDKTPMALIIDSPWIPGYLGVKHMDFYLDREIWFQSHLKIHREFPDIIFVPSWWMEYGMAAEPSALGAKIKFWQDNTPSEYHTLFHIEDIDEFPEYEVENDAFMAMTLHRIRMERQRILDTGEILPMVTSRGPMCTAGFVRGTTNLMIDLVEKPEWAHKLLDLCTRLVIDWLKAQHKAMGNTVEGIFILDDIVGFVNEEHYQEFCHPYLKRICDAFPKDWVKLYHNDAEVQACLDHLPDCGFNMLNWGKQTDIAEVKERVGDRMCLMGNVNPLEVGVRGTPEEVREATLDVLEKGGDRGMILSVGGGTSPGMPRQNIVAMLEALNEFNGKK